jgi:DNA-directed RNA polymerase subunit A"
MAEKEMTDANVPKLLRDQFEKAVKDKKLSERKREDLWKIVMEQYQNSQYETGEAIGIVSAQSISEPATQMTMRTYHFAGSAGIQVTLGLPRVMEVLDARREPQTPMMTIYLDSDHNTVEGAKKIANQIKETKLGDIVLEETIDLLEMQLKLKLDEDKMHKLGIDKDRIKDVFEGTKTVKVAVRGSILAIQPSGEEYTVKDLQKIRHKVLKVHLKGIKGISQALVKQEKTEWVIYTLGSSLSEVLNIRGIDKKRTVTNDIHEVESVLGIEAARNVIIKEIKKVLDDQGLDVNIRHIMLVSDIMTLSGTIRAIGRYGIAGHKNSVLARAAFEETVKHLTKASVKGEKDKLNGVIENIMVGQVAPAGTGTVHLTAKFGKEKE